MPAEHLINEPAADPALWMLDPAVVFLNHGSFGSCPRPVLEFQRELRDRMERHPVQFLARDLEKMLDDARGALAQFLGAKAENLVFVSSATVGINTVLRSLRFEPDDELLVTNQEYNASRNALEFAAQRTGCKAVLAGIPFPLQSADQIVGALMAAVTPRTRLALIDHVTSQTGMALPIARIVDELNARGIDTLIDGAHAPGMVPVDLQALGATYYAGNCHKWLCVPKTAGFLHVRPERQHLVRPLSISHGANSPRKDRSRFLIEFGWTGTTDPTACLSVPEVLRFIGSLLPGGWPEVMSRNRELALAGRKLLCQALNINPPCPEEFIGSLASLPVPDMVGESPPSIGPLASDPLQKQLRADYGIEVPVIPWPAPPKRLLRISAQLYNSLPQYKFLAGALVKCLRQTSAQ